MTAITAGEVAALDASAAQERLYWSLDFPRDLDAADDQSEWAAERAAIAAEAEGEAAGFGCFGLVKVPTTHTARAERSRRAERGAAKASARLRAVLKATVSDQAKARIARMRRSVGFSARTLNVAGHRRGFRDGYVVMLTLTYADGDAWKPTHLTRFTNAVRTHLSRQGVACGYVWVAELQKRGAIHYHVGVWLPHGYLLPKPDERGWWPHGSTKVEAVRDSVAYLMKYMSKGIDGSQRLPDGARMHGSGGLEHSMRRARRWLGYPSFIKARADINDEWTRAKFGGWNSPDGLWVPSEFQRAWIGDRWAVIRVADHGRPFDASGPFSWLSHAKASAESSSQ